MLPTLGGAQGCQGMPEDARGCGKNRSEGERPEKTAVPRKTPLDPPSFGGEAGRGEGVAGGL